MVIPVIDIIDETTPEEGGDRRQCIMNSGKMLTDIAATRRFFQKLKENRVATGLIEGFNNSNQIQKNMKGYSKLKGEK